MANYKANVPKGILPGLLTEKDALAKLIEAVLNQILEAQMAEHLKAKPYERSESRQGYRNGTRVRTLTTWGRPFDSCRSADEGREFFPGYFQALPKERAGFCPRLDGDGDPRGIRKEGQGGYRGLVREFLLKVYGEPSCNRVGCQGVFSHPKKAWVALTHS